MPRFGLGKKSDSDDSSRSGLFGRKKNSTPDNDNPYAQAQDPYANYSQPSAAPRANGPPGGLPSGPRAGYTATPPPPYSGSPQSGPQSGPRYGNEKVGATSGYGANRYDSNSSQSYNGYQGGQSLPPQRQRQGGYGGLGPSQDDAPDENRDALLTGARPTYVGQNGQNGQSAAGSGRYGQPGQDSATASYGGYGEQRELTEEEREELQIQDIKSQINQVRNESLASTQNTLRTADAAIETALGTYNMLGQQEERFYNIQHNFNQANAASREADKKTKDLRKANGSMWNPNNYTSRKQNDEKRIRDQEDYEADKKMREATRRDQFESNAAFQRTQQEIGKRQLGRGSSTRGDHSRFVFEDDDDEDAGFQRQQEEEIDDNINQIGDRVGKLNFIARSMGQKVEEQNKMLEKMDKDLSLLFQLSTALVRLTARRLMNWTTGSTVST